MKGEMITQDKERDTKPYGWRDPPWSKRVDWRVQKRGRSLLHVVMSDDALMLLVLMVEFSHGQRRRYVIAVCNPPMGRLESPHIAQQKRVWWSTLEGAQMVGCENENNKNKVRQNQKIPPLLEVVKKRPISNFSERSRKEGFFCCKLSSSLSDQ
jgi:hypothetical protein